MLTIANLCSIYRRRVGFEFEAMGSDGEEYICTCLRAHGPNGFLKNLPEDVLAQCCEAHPELLRKNFAEAAV
jgi:hypothetical protein